MAEELINSEGQGVTETQEEMVTMTRAEYEKNLQAEGDKRVTQALKTAEKKQSEKLREAQKVANMDAQQKYEYELQQRERAIEEKEKELTLAENRNVCSKILSEKGISLDLVDFVVAEDAETMDSNIKKLEKAFKASVKNEVEKRLHSTVPKQGLPMDAHITKEQFQKMSLADMQKLANENPEVFNLLKH